MKCKELSIDLWDTIVMYLRMVLKQSGVLKISKSTVVSIIGKLKKNELPRLCLELVL